MEQAVLNNIKFMGRLISKTDKPGRMLMSEKVELDRDAVTEVLKKFELSVIQPITEEEPDIFALALDIWEEVESMPGIVDHADFIAFVRDEDSLTGGANYLISATVEADGELADKFRAMIEHANVACAEFNQEDGTIRIDFNKECDSIVPF